jgi:hypothetical protein
MCDLTDFALPSTTEKENTDDDVEQSVKDDLLVKRNPQQNIRYSLHINKLIKVFFYLFSDCFAARMLACTFICQAAVMWLGTALNFILQLLFLPFSFAASSRPNAPPSSNIFTFLVSYSMIPGIVAFSAHYFWFLLQIGCHCFTKTLRKSIFILL